MIKEEIELAQKEGYSGAEEIAEFTGRELGDIKDFLHNGHPTITQAQTKPLRNFVITLSNSKTQMFNEKPVTYWEGLTEDIPAIASNTELLTQVIEFQKAIANGKIASSKSKQEEVKLDVTERSDGTFDLKRGGSRGRPTNFDKLGVEALSLLSPVFKKMLEKENFRTGGYQIVIKVRDRETAGLLFEGREIFEKCLD